MINFFKAQIADAIYTDHSNTQCKIIAATNAIRNLTDNTEPETVHHVIKDMIKFAEGYQALKNEGEEIRTRDQQCTLTFNKQGFTTEISRF